MKCKRMMQWLTAAAAVLLCFSGCEFKTYLKTDKDPNDAVTGFFDCLKSKDWEGCDSYLADDATFTITNSTDFAFADQVLDKQLDSLEYEIVSRMKVKGVEASCFVSISSLDMATIEAAMMEEYPKARSKYILSHSTVDFSTDDKEALNDVMTNAFEVAADKLEPTVKEIQVKLSYQNGDWKVVLNDELCEAVFGGVAEE